jgi:ABC-type nitrate/sulfonate/bicarbonate transport system substrate-binding protein
LIARRELNEQALKPGGIRLMSRNWLQRQRWGALALAALLVVACGGGGGGAQAPTSSPVEQVDPLKVGVYPGLVTSILNYVAQNQGFFINNGLPVTFVNFNQSLPMLTAAQSGGIDVTTNAPPQIMRVIASGTANTDFEVVVGVQHVVGAIIAQPDFPKPTASYPQSLLGLKGKKIGVPFGSFLQIILTAMLKEAGLAATDVQMVNVTTASTVVAAFESRQVDAAIFPEPVITTLPLQGKAYVLVDLRQGKVGPAGLPPGGEEAAQWALSSVVKAHPASIAAFQKSLAEADVWAHKSENRGKLLTIARQELGNSYSLAEMNALVDSFLLIADVSYPKSTMTAWNQFCVNNNIMSSPLDLTKLFAPGVPQSRQEVATLGSVTKN